MSTKNSNYYTLQLALTSSSAIADEIPKSEHNWLSGQAIDHPFSRPLVFKFSPGVMHHYYPLEIPLMSDELLSTLEGFGVENIDKYPAVAHTHGSDAIYCHYKAVNVIGLVNASRQEETLGESIGMSMPSGTVTIDEVSRRGLDLFRIKGQDDIIVSENLKNALEKRFDDLGFMLL
jgi:hypothetical protein